MEQHQNELLQTRAELIALDEMYRVGIREILALKKDIIIKSSAFNDLQVQLQNLLKEKEDLQAAYDKLKSSMEIMASDAQAIEG